MEAQGVRWAMDFGMQEYKSLESKGIQLFGRTQDAQRWTVFRYTNLVHNTLTFNNKHQEVKGYAPIISWGDLAGYKNAITDMSEIYKGSVSKAVRGIAIVNESYVLVRDEIKTLDQETTLRWTMLTPSSVEIIGNRKALLTKNGKNLILEVQGIGNIKMKTWSTDPPHDYNAPNPSTTLVGFEVTLPANTATFFNVTLIPGNAEKSLIKKITSLQSWNNK